MLSKDNSVVVTKVGDVMSIEYNGGSDRLIKCSKNLVTGHDVSLLLDSTAVETDLFCEGSDQYTYDMFNTIGSVPITDNAILYTELVKML
jgi:hypothetical protein